MEPEIRPFEFYLDCFSELHTCRNRMTLSPIPFTSIAEFAKLKNIEDFDEFLYLMRVLDNVYLEHHSKEEKRNAKAKSDTNNKS